MHLAGKAILNNLLDLSFILYQMRSLPAGLHSEGFWQSKAMIKYQSSGLKTSVNWKPSDEWAVSSVSFNLHVLHAQCNNDICISLQFTNMLRIIHLHWVKPIQVFCSMGTCWEGCTWCCHVWTHVWICSWVLTLPSSRVPSPTCFLGTWHVLLSVCSPVGIYPTGYRWTSRVGFPKLKKRSSALFPAQAFIHPWLVGGHRGRMLCQTLHRPCEHRCPHLQAAWLDLVFESFISICTFVFKVQPSNRFSSGPWSIFSLLKCP